jgi:hypothetical protein
MNVIIEKDGKQVTYKNMAEATHENGAGSGMSKASGLRFFERKGIKVVNRDEIENSIGTRSDTSGTSSTKKDWMTKAMEEFLKVDAGKIQTLQAELVSKVSTDLSTAGLQEIVKLKETITKLQNPQPTRDGFLDFVSTKYDEWEKAQAPDPVQAPEKDKEEEKPKAGK